MAYYRTVGDPITMGNYADLPPEQRPGYTRTAVPTAQGVSYAQPGNVQYAQTQQQYSYSTAPAAANAPTRSPNVQYSTTPSNITYTTKPVVDTSQPSVRRSAQPMSPAYPSPGGQVQYTAMPRAPPQPPAAQPVYSPQPMGPPSPSSEHQRALSISTSSRDGRKVVEMVPGGGGGGGGFAAPPSPGGHRPSLSVGGGGGGHRPERLRMDRLSVSGGRPDLQTFSPGGGSPSGGLPPPSPLLEAYHGTYQSISPLPSAMMFDDNLDHLPPLDAMSPRDMGHGRHHQSFSDRRQSFSDRSPSPPSRSKGKDRLALAAYGGGRFDEPPKKEKRRVKIYDATDDALALVEAMGAKPVNADTLIDILPALSHDQILELRIEFKRHCKLQGRGINIAKYIKLKTSGNFGKIAHVTALGRYESEGFWANYWYQSHTSQRELLIEALMGRQNHEIREIKDAFKDKRYGDSLVKCMDKELKADKFRKAILMALEGERQEESDVWEIEYRNRDVETLYRALNAREGGESAMLSIVVMRSDAHMREILRTYERRFQGNFARDALKKSNNLVVSLPTPNPPTTPSNIPQGRSHSAHPQRRHQPARPRRHAPAPRAHGSYRALARTSTLIVEEIIQFFVRQARAPATL